jgi:DNA polymerase-1
MDLAERFRQFSAQQSEQPIGLNGKVLLIDGLNTYIRAFAATPTMNDDGGHVGGITGFLMSIAAVIRTQRPSRVIIMFDGAGGSLRRRQIFDDYKGNRRTRVKLNRTYDFSTIDDEEDARKRQLMMLVALLRCLPITIMAPQHVEADDVIAYLAQITEERDGKAIILSTDKDFLQLVNEKITVWNPIKKKMYRPESVLEDYGIHPANFLLYRVLSGDDSDNIPGVKGVGEKTLTKHFPQITTGEKMTVNELIKAAEEKSKVKVCQKIAESRILIERNAKLMRLDDVAMSGTTRVSVLNQFDAPVPRLEKAEFIKLLSQNRMMNVFNNFEDWLNSSFVPLMRFNMTQGNENE